MATMVLDDFVEIFGTEVEPDWLLLGRAVVRQRIRVDLTQEKVAALGGPSSETMRLIESAGRSNYRLSTVRRLDEILHWPPNGYLYALAGEDPYLAMTKDDWNWREYDDYMHPDSRARLEAKYGPREEDVTGDSEDSFPTALGGRADIEVSNREILDAVIGLRREFDFVQEQNERRFAALELERETDEWLAEHPESLGLPKRDPGPDADRDGDS